MLEGKNKSLNEQLLVLESILNKSKKIKEILRVLEQYSKENQDFKNYYLAAGCVNQTIFNYYHNYDLDYGIGDYDIVYYDEEIVSTVKHGETASFEITSDIGKHFIRFVNKDNEKIEKTIEIDVGKPITVVYQLKCKAGSIEIIE